MITLTNVGANYDTISAAKGLGLGLVDFTGVTAITLAVYCNKIGSGTQTWQLWNVTDAAEIGAIADAGVSGEKALQQTFSVALSGVKIVRVRVKSTVAGDDPVFYGGAILVAG